MRAATEAQAAPAAWVAAVAPVAPVALEVAAVREAPVVLAGQEVSAAQEVLEAPEAWAESVEPARWARSAVGEALSGCGVARLLLVPA
jgi:hypothetical protein